MYYKFLYTVVVFVVNGKKSRNEWKQEFVTDLGWSSKIYRLNFGEHWGAAGSAFRTTVSFEILRAFR